MLTYKIFIGIPEGKRQLGRPKYRCEDTIKMDLKEIGCEDMDLIYLTQDTIQWWALYKHDNEPSGL
jgi:hypothetical protein